MPAGRSVEALKNRATLGPEARHWSCPLREALRWADQTAAVSRLAKHEPGEETVWVPASVCADIEAAARSLPVPPTITADMVWRPSAVIVFESPVCINWPMYDGVGTEGALLPAHHVRWRAGRRGVFIEMATLVHFDTAWAQANYRDDVARKHPHADSPTALKELGRAEWRVDEPAVMSRPHADIVAFKPSGFFWRYGERWHEDVSLIDDQRAFCHVVGGRLLEPRDGDPTSRVGDSLGVTIAEAASRRWLFAAWQFASVPWRQARRRLPRTETRPVDRQAGKPRFADRLKGFHIIDLPALAAGQPEQQNGETDRRVSVRHWVRGHWRNQWYPGAEKHRLIWVSQHVRGHGGLPWAVKQPAVYRLNSPSTASASDGRSQEGPSG